MTMDDDIYPEFVVQAALQVLHITRAELLRPSKTPHICWARHETAWLLGELTPLSAARIGAILGGRDPKTIFHSCGRVTEKRGKDAGYRARMDRMVAYVRHRAGKPDTATVSAMVGAILSDRKLTDADARAAALQILERVA